MRQYDFMLKGLEEVESECERLSIALHVSPPPPPARAAAAAAAARAAAAAATPAID